MQKEPRKPRLFPCLFKIESIQDKPEFLTTSVSGNDGNAAARLGVSSRLDYILSSRLDFVHTGCLGASGGLDLIQARDDAAVEDVGGFGPDLGDKVAQFAGIGHVLLKRGLRHVDPLDQRLSDRGVCRLDGQKLLALLDRLLDEL